LLAAFFRDNRKPKEGLVANFALPAAVIAFLYSSAIVGAACYLFRLRLRDDQLD